MSITITLTDAQERTLRRAAETRGKRAVELAGELLQRDLEVLASILSTYHRTGVTTAGALCAGEASPRGFSR